jgi:Zinc-binding
MGGGNGQKSAAARERNQKKLGKSEEDRKAAALKAAKDAQAHKCQLCLMTFMINVKPPTLLDHVVKKHPAGTDPASCFSSLANYDPNAPATAAPAATGTVVKPKPKKKDDANLDDLLSAGLGKAKKK